MKILNNYLVIDKSFYRFVIVGISNTIISYITFICIYKFIIVDNTIVSQIFSYSAGIIWSFIWNRKWTFKSNNNAYKEFLLFVFSQLILLALSSLMLYVVIDKYHYSASLGWIVVMAIITIINFFTLKFLIFK